MADDFLTPEQAAEFLGIAATTLATWRVRRSDGPPFRRHGRRIRYSRSDLLVWSAKHAYASTSEYAEKGGV